MQTSPLIYHRGRSECIDAASPGPSHRYPVGGAERQAQLMVSNS